MWDMEDKVVDADGEMVRLMKSSVSSALNHKHRWWIESECVVHCTLSGTVYVSWDLRAVIQKMYHLTLDKFELG